MKQGGDEERSARHTHCLFVKERDTRNFAKQEESGTSNTRNFAADQREKNGLDKIESGNGALFDQRSAEEQPDSEKKKRKN